MKKIIDMRGLPEALTVYTCNYSNESIRYYWKRADGSVVMNESDITYSNDQVVYGGK